MLERRRREGLPWIEVRAQEGLLDWSPDEPLLIVGVPAEEACVPPSPPPVLVSARPDDDHRESRAVLRREDSRARQRRDASSLLDHNHVDGVVVERPLVYEERIDPQE